MKISYHWLKQYINIDTAPEELSKILVDLGLEVESVETVESIKGGLKGFLVGEVKECQRHPNADKLSVTKVDIGNGPLLDIVCGAPNVAAGQKVIVATIGTTVYTQDGSFEIKKAKIRGENSEGMLCAADEIGIGNSHDGILVLPNDVKVGLPAAEYFNVVSDVVFEIGLTPNRVDAASHYGIARDLAAYFRLNKQAVNCKLPDISGFGVDDETLKIPVTVENPHACPRYCGISISGLSVKESPEWLQNRLKSIGMKPINNVVDITNFVLHELGQPLHAFDADKIKGKKVIIKTYEEGKEITTLDGVTRKLSSSDLVISDSNDAMCIAGVFGGLETGTTENTKNIFLESAYFHPVWVRKTARRHMLSTDSSFRFERGADPNMATIALKRAAMLIKELAGGKISSSVFDFYPEPISHQALVLHFDYVNKLIGKKIPIDTIKSILTSLEIIIEKETSTELELSIPPYKVDVKKEADVVEEIMRVYGYNNIDIPIQLKASLNNAEKPDKYKLVNMISDYLSSNGFNEIMSNSLTKSAYYKDSEKYASRMVSIENPLSGDLNCMRQSLIFGGLEAIQLNNNHKIQNIKIYEFGNIYWINESYNGSEVLKKFKEEQHLALFMSGLKQEVNWNSPASYSDFYYLKAFVNNILFRIGINTDAIKQEGHQCEYISEGLSYEVNKKTIAVFGYVHPALLKKMDIKGNAFYADICWDAIIPLITNHAVKYKEIPKYPEVERDLSMLIDEQIKFEQIEKAARKAEKKLLKDINLFDVYKGDKIEAGKKSYAIRFMLQDESKTLTDKEIETVMEQISKQINIETGAKIRQ